MGKTGTTRAAAAERGARYSDGRPERVRMGRELAAKVRAWIAAGREAELEGLIPPPPDHTAAS